MRPMASAGLRLIACAVALTVGASAEAQNPAPLAAQAKVPAAPSATATPLLQPGQPIPPEALAAFVDGVMAAEMKTDHIAGATISVVQDGKVVLKRGYGVAAVGPDRPVDPDRTLFRLGSISKLFLWTVMAQEVEAGRLDPRRPIDAYLPARLRLKTAFPEPVTLERLMSHSAGLEDRALGHLGAVDPARLTSLETFLLTARPRQVRAPGHASYSNYGADLAGWILATRAGVDFETLVDRRISAPLGLQRTSFREARPARAGLPAPMDAAMAADLSKGFRWSQGAFKPGPTELIGSTAPAGSASSTAADMARVMQIMLGDGVLDSTRLYGPKATSLLRTPIIPVPAGMNGWAHGLMITAPGGRAGYGHGGDTFMFHANLVTVPELKLGLFIGTNTSGGEKLAGALPELVVAHFYGRALVGGAFRTPSPGEMKAYEGIYLSTRRDFTGAARFAGLMSGGEITATPQGLLVDNGNGAKPYLATAEPGVFRTADRTGVVSFDFDHGKPVRWRTSFNTSQWERADPWDQPTPLVVVAGLALLAAVAVIVGLCTRRRPYPQTSGQMLASRTQTAAATAWLASALAFAAWSSTTGDEIALVTGWPSPQILAFGWASVVATALSAISVALLVPVWSGRGDGAWGLTRKLRYSATAGLFVALAVILALRGALQPWTT